MTCIPNYVSEHSVCVYINSIMMILMSFMCVDIEEDKECDASVCIIEESGEDRPVWIGCECGTWVHYFCVHIKDPCVNCAVTHDHEEMCHNLIDFEFDY